MGSPAYSKAKGRKAENAVVEWLRERGWVNAERRRLAGVADRGDIAGMPGVTVEVKDEKRLDLAGAVTELVAEMANTGDTVGLALIKRRGFPHDVGSWYAVMPADVAARLLKEAGY